MPDEVFLQPHTVLEIVVHELVKIATIVIIEIDLDSMRSHDQLMHVNYALKGRKKFLENISFSWRSIDILRFRPAYLAHSQDFVTLTLQEKAIAVASVAKST